MFDTADPDADADNGSLASPAKPHGLMPGTESAKFNPDLNRTEASPSPILSTVGEQGGAQGEAQAHQEGQGQGQGESAGAGADADVTGAEGGGGGGGSGGEGGGLERPPSPISVMAQIDRGSPALDKAAA